jgi:hypothetical protein
MLPYSLFTGGHGWLLHPERIINVHELGSSFTLQRSTPLCSWPTIRLFPRLRLTRRVAYFDWDVFDSSRVLPSLPFYHISLIFFLAGIPRLYSVVVPWHGKM